jgi:hypothetical protein
MEWASQLRQQGPLGLLTGIHGSHHTHFVHGREVIYIYLVLYSGWFLRHNYVLQRGSIGRHHDGIPPDLGVGHPQAVLRVVGSRHLPPDHLPV